MVFERCPLFKGLAPVRPAQFVVIERRRALFGQGGPADSVVIIGAGRARLFKSAPERVITLAYRGPGELVGEDALFAGERFGGQHSAEARAIDRVEAVRVPAEVFRARLRADPELSERMLELMDQRRREVEQRLESILTKTVEARVAEFLVQAGRDYGVPDPRGTLIGVKFTHLEIATFVGSTRETVTLVLGELKRRGHVHTEHRRIIVKDVDALARLSV